MENNDITLIKKLKKNDYDALDLIINKYNLYVASIVSQILYGCLNELDIQAVINNVFFLLWNNAKNIDIKKSTSLKAYIGKIARNAALNEKKKALQRELSFDEHFIGILHDQYNQVELQNIIINALDQLKENEQQILLKFYFQSKKIAEISDELCIPQATVKTQLKRSREKLKKILTEGGYIYEN